MNSVALITGGGRGLGRAFALALARNGMRVAVASRSADELELTVSEVRAAGGESVAIVADVTDEAAVRAMVAKVENELGPIDLLVNNAGLGAPFGPTWETDTTEWWRNVEVNLKGPLLASNAVIPGMIDRGRGRIINVASGAGTVSFPYMSAYVTSKTALIRFTEVLADELREHGVFVFAIHPGTVNTAMTEDLLRSKAGQRWLPWFKDIFDNQRDVTSKAAEDLILELASGQADALSGRFFSVSGPPIHWADHTDGILKDSTHVLRVRNRT